MQGWEAVALAEIGNGGFAAPEFELQNQLGRLSWVCSFSAFTAVPFQCCAAMLRYTLCYTQESVCFVPVAFSALQ